MYQDLIGSNPWPVPERGVIDGGGHPATRLNYSSA
jgi:hypothetical protein